MTKAATRAYHDGWERIFGKQPTSTIERQPEMTAMMESTPANLIGAMFTIQNALNTKSYDKAWIEKGKTEEFDYAMAAGDEAHEFLRSLPFQWWTKDKADRQNQVTEIVDAWHFVMSQYIIDHNGNVDAAVAGAVDIHEKAKLFLQLEETVKKQAKLFVAALYVHNTRHGEMAPGYVGYFFKLCEKAEISLDLLYARYLGKATLNKFRVANGYKQGTYKKIWELGGIKAEDNYFLSSYVDTVLAAGGEFSEENVQGYLEQAYSSMTAQTATA